MRLARNAVLLAAGREKRTEHEAYLFLERSAVAKIGRCYQTIGDGLLAARVLFDPLFPLLFQICQTDAERKNRHKQCRTLKLLNKPSLL